MFVLLFGPPASGKSTIVNLAKKKGIIAFDLEKRGRGPKARAIRNRAAKDISYRYKEKDLVIVGMASVHPGIFPRSSKYIILLPPKNIYKKRLAYRDARNPLKKGQDALKYFEEFKKWSKKYTHVLKGNMTPEETLKRILKIANIKK